MTTWRDADVPDQTGRVAVVTGANTGIGFEIALALARYGASVVLACRNRERAEAAAARIDEQVPDAEVSVAVLDLASLASVRAAAAELVERHRRIDLLINNAGVNSHSARTEDGFELHFAVNHLGHFALTGLLLDRMRDVAGSRVVTVSSLVHHVGRMDLDRLDDPRRAYVRAKLANLMFSLALHRWLERAGAATIAVAAHPGGVSTDLLRELPFCLRWATSVIGGSLFGLTAAKGARPTLRAALDPAARGGDFYGPGDPVELFGGPARVHCGAPAVDVEVQDRLWAESERLTGVRFGDRGFL
ncbi:SDR family NAD(P)-dependent oxidoreductase [Pseudonocardia eucalypti]|uniref:SDR family NAD(P)-dependent oxidoreductase n=1 Tax=Pseudonocardia eucalypti TaxID=648755 RepID=A0ABP9PSE4_9PSEU|nr:NAD(P)-dependent dehydrogenase (short-subunit alcohol dehydrogenase family) [Pseudonocardia eucalypti]